MLALLLGEKFLSEARVGSLREGGPKIGPGGRLTDFKSSGSVRVEPLFSRIKDSESGIASETHSGVVLGYLLGAFGRLWAPFGLLGGHLGAFGCPLGSFGAPLGSFGMPLGGFWDPLGSFSCHLGSFYINLVYLLRYWGGFGRIRDAFLRFSSGIRYVFLSYSSSIP